MEAVVSARCGKGASDWLSTDLDTNMGRFGCLVLHINCCYQISLLQVTKQQNKRQVIIFYSLKTEIGHTLFVFFNQM